jgi:hypothetical protein
LLDSLNFFKYAVKVLDKNVSELIELLEKVKNSLDYKVSLSFDKKYLVISKLNSESIYSRWIFNNKTKLFLFFYKDKLNYVLDLLNASYKNL